MYNIVLKTTKYFCNYSIVDNVIYIESAFKNKISIY